MRTIAMHGQLDRKTAPDAVRGLTGHLTPGEATRLDLSAVTWIDSAGLAELVRLLAAARRQGGDLVVERASDTVLRMMALARLDTLFPAAAA